VVTANERSAVDRLARSALAHYAKGGILWGDIRQSPRFDAGDEPGSS